MLFRRQFCVARLALILAGVALFTSCGHEGRAEQSPTALRSMALDLPAGGASFGSFNVADLESNTDVVVLAKVSKIAPAHLNVLRPGGELKDRNTLETSVPITAIDLQVESVVASRQQSRFELALLEKNATIRVSVRHGRVDFETSFADRQRLGLSSTRDESGRPVLQTGTVTLSKAFDSEIRLEVGQTVVAYLSVEDFGYADDSSVSNRLATFALGKFSIFAVRSDGAISAPKGLRGAESLTNLETLNESASRVSRAESPARMRDADSIGR